MSTGLTILSGSVLIVADLISGCQRSRDSAALREWRFSQHFRIGQGADDPHGFSEVRGVLVTRGGNIWLLETSTHNIRIFDSTGRPLREVGRKGNGPGEFMWPDGMATAPDGHVWVHDPQNGRFSIFDESGAFLREQSLQSAGYYASVWSGGIDGSGRIWDDMFWLRDPQDPLARRWRRIAPDWSRTDTLTFPSCRVPGWNRRDGVFWRPWEGRPGANLYWIPIPFYPQPVEAYDLSGDAVWCAPSGATYRLVKFGIERKDTLAQIVGTAEAVPVTTQERDSAIAEAGKILKRIGVVAEPDWSRIPTERPLVMGAFVDEENRLWVRRSTPDRTSLFDVYSSGGKPIATVRFPHSVSGQVRPVVRGHRIWLVALDEEEVPYVLHGWLNAADPGGRSEARK
jgi:hypothetical protein